MIIGREGGCVVGTQKPNIGGEKTGLGRGDIVDLGQGLDAISSFVHQNPELSCINMLGAGRSSHWGFNDGIVQGVLKLR